MLETIFSPLAETDLLEIWLFIAEDSTTHADTLLDKIKNQLDSIGQQPEMGRLRPELGLGLRSFPVGNYIIFYRVEIENIQVIRILNGSRDISFII
jgi:toxin ParE1/3/4